MVNFAMDDAWRMMFMLGALPGLALFIGMFALGDTPRWLALKGRDTEAQATIARLRGVSVQDALVLRELTAITHTAADNRGAPKWSDLLAPYVKPVLVVSIGLFLLQQLSGINAVIYYAPTIFQEAGFDSHATQVMATIGVGIVNVGMTIVGMMLIDRIGRRKLLFIGFTGTALSLGMIAIGAATGAQSLDVLAVAGLVLYIAAFAVSIGPLPWVMMSELFPQHVRGLGMSVTSLANWGFNFLVVFSFPVLVAFIGLGGVFGIYALICVIGLIFTARLVPETNGVSLEEIERHLKSGQPLRQLGAFPQEASRGYGVAHIIDTQADGTDHETADLIRAIIRLSPYQTALMPLINNIARIAHGNTQIRLALQAVSIRADFQKSRRVRRVDLAGEASTLFAFLEHIRFASPEFLKSVGEWPVGGKRG